MFANWAAHIELAHNRSPHRKLLRAFEQEYLQVIQNGQKWTTTPYENLSVLKTSVLDFLREFSLPDARLQDQETWRDFALLYLQDISDCPITLPGLLPRRFGSCGSFGSGPATSSNSTHSWPLRLGSCFATIT